VRYKRNLVLTMVNPQRTRWHGKAGAGRTGGQSGMIVQYPVRAAEVTKAPNRDVVGRVLIVVLAYNESLSIVDTLSEIVATVDGCDLLVVDDGSEDDTAARVRRMGIPVARHAMNRGVAAAEATACRCALMWGYSAMLRMDGDGQHDPRSAGQLLSAIENGADLVVGSRYLRKGTTKPSFARRTGSTLLRAALFASCRQRFTDPTSGFRGFSRRALAQFSRQTTSDYPEPQSLYCAAKKGWRVVEVPVKGRGRRFGRSSLVGVRGMLFCVRTCAQILLDSLRAR
jgi:glycosyltransferase involved in cell wall biosynthesis